jgi:hypothetical protein
MDLRLNTDYFPVQKYLTRFRNRNGEFYCAVRTESLNVTDIGVSLKSFKDSGNVITSNSFFWFAHYSKYFYIPTVRESLKGLFVFLSCKRVLT